MTRWTEAQLERHQIRQRAKIPRARARAKAEIPDRRNKTEAAYEEYLDLLIKGGALAWRSGHEPVRFNLGPGSDKSTRAWFTPDYMVEDLEGLVEFHDVKGFYREAAKVRIRVAAGLYPMFRWKAVSRKAGAWHEEVFG